MEPQHLPIMLGEVAGPVRTRTGIAGHLCIATSPFHKLGDPRPFTVTRPPKVHRAVASNADQPRSRVVRSIGMGAQPAQRSHESFAGHVVGRGPILRACERIAPHVSRKEPIHIGHQTRRVVVFGNTRLPASQHSGKLDTNTVRRKAHSAESGRRLRPPVGTESSTSASAVTSGTQSVTQAPVESERVWLAASVRRGVTSLAANA